MTIKSETVEGLVQSGDYGAAAALARDRGDLARAAELFEKVWDFEAAAQCSEAAGDFARALRNAIAARQPQEVDRIAKRLGEDGPQSVRTAIEILSGGRWFGSAATLAESVEDYDEAIDLYRKAHRDLEAARLMTSVGRDNEAGRLLEQFISASERGPERASAHLDLGNLLARRLQHTEAVKHLQAAAEEPATRDAARRRLIIELVALDLRDAARQVLVSARQDDPSLPLDLEAFVRANRGTSTPAERDLVAGRYLLGELIGAGGSGRVYRGKDEVTRKFVAVKLFDLAHARGHHGYERFVRETGIAGDLHHPNIVTALDFSAEHGYLVMELMDGGSLADKLKPRLTQPAVRRLALELLSGLEAAHRHGIIHRDIKPANIFFDARGISKIGDFGVAHLLDLGQTQTGGLIGTIAYMSPEQITGARLSITADFYSLGITLFESLTGHLPFRGPDFIAEHLGSVPPKPRDLDPGLAAGWDDILDRLLRKSPTERFATVGEIRSALQSLDLSEHANQPLLLPKATRAHRLVRTTAAPPIADATPTAPEEPTERYQFETQLGKTPISNLTRAVDSILGRTVIIERFETGSLDEATTERLYRLAGGGGPFLQRSLSFDASAGVLVYEAPSGSPIADLEGETKLGRRQVSRLLKRLARALAPLHRGNRTHGTLHRETVLIDSLGFPTIMASGLGLAPADASCTKDIEQIIAAVDAVAAEPVAALVADLVAAPWPARNAHELLELAGILEVAILRSRPPSN